MQDRSGQKRRLMQGMKPGLRNAGTGLPAFVVLALTTLIVVAVTLLAHWPALSAQALSVDDDQYLTANPLVQHPGWTSAGRFLGEVLRPSTVDGYYQPLAMISLMLDYAIAGGPDNLRPFHRTSLLLHAANTALVIVLLYMLFPLTRRLPACREGPRNAASPPAADAACQGFGQPWVAAMVGLLFGVHPMTVETIPWIGERKTLLATFFALWSLLLYVRCVRTGRAKWYGLSLAAFVLALMSKPTTVPIPLVLLVLDWWPLNRLSRRAMLEKVPFFLLAGVFAVITVVSQHHIERSAVNSFSVGQTVLLMCHDLVFYPSKMAWPAGLSSFYAFPESVGLSNGMLSAGAAVSAAILVLLVISLRWTRALTAGWMCFFVLLLPTMLNKSYSPSIVWNKYAYLPAVGLLLILAWVLDRVWSGGAEAGRSARRVGLAAVVAIIAVLLATGTRRQLSHWQTTQKLCDYTIGVAPTAYPFYHHRGNSYREKGDYGLAIRDYSKAIELKPTYAEAYSNRGVAFVNMRDFDQAIRDCTTAVKLAPTYAAAYSNRGVAFMGKGDFDQAIRDCTTAIELQPTFAAAYKNRGTACGRKGDYDRAVADLSQAIELQPDDAGSHSNRGNAYLGKGDDIRAIRDYSRAIDLKPDYADAYHGRAIARARLKEYDKAWADVRIFRRLGGTPSPDLVRSLIGATGRTE